MRSYAFALTLLLAAGPSAFAAEWHGRGIHALPSNGSCPFGELGMAECNRIALDDGHTRARLDQAGKISFRNTHDYKDEATVADLLVHGTGTASGEIPVHLSFHLVLSKEGQRWSVNTHVHAPVPGTFEHVEIQGYTVEVNGPKGAEILLTSEQMRQALEQPSYKARVASKFVQVRDNRAKTDATPDITVALGRGKLAASVLRARLHGPSYRDDDLTALFKTGTWALELTALTRHLPREVVRREMFLYGLEALPALQPLLREGLRKNDSLVIGAAKGKGYVRFHGKTVPFAQAREAVRRYLQQSFIGMVLGSQQKQHTGDHPHAH